MRLPLLRFKRQQIERVLAVSCSQSSDVQGSEPVSLHLVDRKDSESGNFSV